jgi:hypothetical protein
VSQTTVDVTGAILAGDDYAHDLETRVQHHPRSTDEQDHDAAIISEFFVSADSRISQIRESSIFRAAAELAAGECECRGIEDKAHRDRSMYAHAAVIVQNPLASGLSPEEIEMRVERASFCVA